MHEPKILSYHTKASSRKLKSYLRVERFTYFEVYGTVVLLSISCRNSMSKQSDGVPNPAKCRHAVAYRGSNTYVLKRMSIVTAVK